MGEREIQYEETGDLTVCPCCGVGTIPGLAIWSCAACWVAHRDGFRWSGAAYDTMVAGRAWFHALGVRLRAEGKMPALGKAAEKADDGRRYGVWCQSEVNDSWSLMADGTGSWVKAVGPLSEMESLCRRYNGIRAPGVTYSVRPYDAASPEPAPVTQRSPTLTPPAPLIPDEATLARLLFDNDAAVLNVVADMDHPWRRPEHRSGPYHVSRTELLDRAWARTSGAEAERREWAVEMAKRVFADARERVKAKS